MTAKQVHVAFMVGSLRMGGAERMMIQTANGLTAKFKVSFLSLTGGDDLKKELDPSITLYSFDKRKSLAAIPQVLKFINQEKPDVLISTQLHVNVIAVMLKVIFRKKVKVVLREATSPGAQFQVFKDVKSRLTRHAVKFFY